ncbi:MAG: hypothetical protein ACR2NS_02865 [Gemmatimonadaceae bacterium]
MLDTPINFRPLRESALLDLIGMHGIYVVWDARKENRPTYIGGGNLLKCIGDHFRNEYGPFQAPVDGYVAVVGPEKHESVKIFTKAIKHLLLDVALDINRSPRVRGAHSAPDPLLGLLREHGSFRVSLNGYDPLTAPSDTPAIAGARTIIAWTLDREDYLMEHSKTIPASLYRLPQQDGTHNSRLLPTR